MRIGVIGSRDFNDYDKVKEVLSMYKITTLISGGARGADSLGERYAKDFNIKKIIFKPDWDKYGMSAGFIRNTTIVNNSDLVIAFWDKKSNGTRDSISKCYKSNTPLLLIFT